MGAVLVIIGVAVGLAVVLLALPLDVRFRFEGIEPFQGQVAIRGLFGLVRLRIGIPGASRRKLRPRTAAARERRPSRSRLDVLAALRQPEFRRRAYVLVADLFRAAHPQQLRVRIRLGLGDPADTGRLWALVGPLNALAQNLRNTEIMIEPEFMEPVLRFQTQGRFLVIPLQFVGLAVRFALSPPAIQAWRIMRGGHG